MNSLDFGRSKRKNFAHIIGDRAVEIIRNQLPQYWTIREYKPDYGIDLSVEIFEKVSDECRDYDTLGEHIFIQVKGVDGLKTVKHKIKKRFNVEKEIKTIKDDFIEVDVIKFQIETPLLLTIQKMSNVIPVMLFVVDTKTEEIFYININDYIDKLIIPLDPLYTKKGSKVVIIPKINKINKNHESLQPLLFYAKRPKLYSFFNKVNYQNKELNFTSEEDLYNQLKRFSDILLTIDIWKGSEVWPILDRYKKALFNFDKGGNIGLLKTVTKPDDTDETWESEFSNGKFYTEKEIMEFAEARQLWRDMSNLYNLYEEFCRELYLPTMIAFSDRF